MSKTKSNRSKFSLKKLAPIGLWVSGVALVITILLSVVKLLAFAKIYTIPSVQTFNWLLWVSAAFIILGLASHTLINPQRVRELITGRQARYGSNAVLLIVSFMGILLVINILIFQTPGKPWDLTEGRQNSLATESLAALKALPQPVHATAFFTTQTDPTSTQKLLTNFKNNSSGKFSFEFVNPDQNPLVAQQAGITGDGKIYLQLGTQHEIVSSATEQEVTSALIRLMNPKKQTVYFLTGHGERDIQNSGNSSYTIAKAALVAKNYQVKSLNLISDNKIPADASVIVIAGPIQPVSTAELLLLQGYLSKGGALILLQEPTPLTKFGTSIDPLANYLESDWGISFSDDIVIDTNSNQPLYAVAATYGKHPITEKLQGLVSFFPTSRSLTIASNAANSPVALVTTSSSAWGETDFSSLQSNSQPAFQQGKDIPGPLVLAVTSQNTSTGSHLVVYGDSDFASDVFFDQYANGDIFMNSIDWAVGQTQLISLSSPKAVTRTFVLPSSLWLLVMAISFLCLLPGMIIAGGVISWYIRRTRG